MNGIVRNLWLIPVLPLLAAAVTAVLKQRYRKPAAALAVLSMIGALGLSCAAFAHAFQSAGHGAVSREFFNFEWFRFGDPNISDPSLTALRLGWLCFEEDETPSRLVVVQRGKRLRTEREYLIAALVLDRTPNGFDGRAGV